MTYYKFEEFGNAYYDLWRKNRIKVLVDVLGKDWMIGKSVLECGAGHGLVGACLRDEYGMKATIMDGREAHIHVAIQEFGYDTSTAMVADQDTTWDLDVRFSPLQFDLVLHWGLLYHLDNWKDDIIRAWLRTKNTGFLSVETQCVDAPLDFIEVKHQENLDGNIGDQALHKNGTATKFAAAQVEKVLNDLSLFTSRYDRPDLNVLFHRYDWMEGELGVDGSTIGTRRFWMIRKEEGYDGWLQGKVHTEKSDQIQGQSQQEI